MSIDLPSSVERELEKYAESHKISVAEAAVLLLKAGLSAKDRKGHPVVELSEDELRRFDEAFPNLSIPGVTDEEWDRIARSTRKMRREGLPPLA